MNIVLLDEHLLLTEALQILLLRMPEVAEVRIYNDGKDLLANTISNPPDVLIMDLMLNGMTGLEMLDVCRTTLPKEMKIIILSTISDAQTVRYTIRKGANSFLSKSTPLDELQDAIRQVFAGRQYIGKSIRDNLANSVFTDEQIILHLSPREKEVLQKVCSGRTIKEIAYELKLSAHTVQYYHRSVMHKLKVKRTTDLIVQAMKHGLYVPDGK
ncbi:response regulator [Dyadobacter sandarakinus]|uniref:Response regulator transcription factor n=1 Tax=Dyadobacter sandarakinus TaxID=2747268 RepID=A0ABX7IDN2_9BACT|nr:response regulator transcription factor [Dyadobacter sandarakinus]QRR03910.1 response regulator transcription factor [Dyadobacter sandarakinus]